MNVHLVLAMQETGGGQSEASVTGGMLDLCPDAMSNTFTMVEDEICILERQLGKEQLEESVRLEKLLSEKDSDGKTRLAVTGDTRWDQVGSRNDYNLDSGCQLVSGCVSKHVLAACCMS
jgi:hypothetical protein